MNTVARALTIALLLLAAGSSAWGEQVVTIYFAGTGLTEAWWDPDQTDWKNHEELLATLYREQLSQADHHKLFVDGIGTGCGFALIDLIGQGLPVLNLCRGWGTVLGEARTFLDDVIADHPGESVTLNLLGFSRGGVTAILFATDVSGYGAIDKINLLAFDPVAGDYGLEVTQPGRFCLGDKINEYVGLYASDERSLAFAPAIPDTFTHDVKGTLLRVPGSHETMMGNIQKDGHSIPFGTAFDTNLHSAFWVSKFIAVELLGAQDWGEVEFSWDWTTEIGPGDTAKSLFLSRVARMYAYTSDYQTNIRNHSFLLDVGFESAETILGVTICDPTILTPDHLFKPRCASRFRCGWIHLWTPLTSNMGPLEGEDIWDVLFALPIADAGEDQTVSADEDCLGLVTLDGTGSSHPDGADLTYLWTWNDGGGEATGPTPMIELPLGTHEITLVVSDGQVDSEPDTVLITVVDTTPPVIELVGSAEMTLECAVDEWVDPGATATDNCDADVSVTVGGDTVDPFTLGDYVVTYDAVDASGNAAVQVTRTVTVSDTLAPTFESLSAVPAFLWPPNHAMIPIHLTVEVWDHCDPSPVVALASVTSNEPDNAPGVGDGNTTGDIQDADTGTEDHDIQLRAERQGGGSGRIYSITYEATDASANRSESTAEVKVQHSQSKAKPSRLSRPIRRN